MADSGSTILNLPATAALGDTDVLPLARPSGTTAPGTDLGLSGAALKAVIAALAAKGGLFRGAWAANTKYLQYDSTFIPAGNPNAGLLAYATVAFTSPAAYVAANWTLEPGQSTNDYTSPEKAKLSGLALASGISQPWQTGGGTGSPGYKANQLLHNSAGVDFYYLADITGTNASAEPLLTTSTNATNALVHSVGTWQYVGAPAKANISLGPLDSTVTLIAAAQYNTFYYSVFKTGPIDSYMCSYGTYFGGAGTAVGTGHLYNSYGGDCAGLVLGARHISNRFGNGISNCTIGDDFTYSIIGENCGFLTIGAGCTRIELYNCRGNGTTGNFVIPAGTHDAVYRNNALVTAGGTTAQATATALGTVRGGGTGNVSINADGSMTATAADTLSVLPYAASIAIDFNAETVRTLAATGNVAFAASVNVAALKTKELYLSNTTGAAITLTFPAWTFFPGPAPTTLAAGKQAVLTLRSLGTTDAAIKAAYVAQT